ncbi:hypothetical protein [Carp edema virus]|nr:hypothetical protein [Carp edema virus]
MDPEKFVTKTEEFLEKEKLENSEYESISSVSLILEELEFQEYSTLEEILVENFEEVKLKVSDLYKHISTSLNEDFTTEIKLEPDRLEPCLFTMKILEDVALDIREEIPEIMSNKKNIELVFHYFNQGNYEFNSFFIRRNRGYIIILGKQTNTTIYNSEIIDNLYDEFSFDSIKKNKKTKNRFHLAKNYNGKTSDNKDFNPRDRIFMVMIYTPITDFYKKESSDDEIDQSYFLKFRNVMHNFKPDPENILNILDKKINDGCELESSYLAYA